MLRKAQQVRTYVLFVSHKYQRRLCDEKKEEEEEEEKNKFNNSFRLNLLSLFHRMYVYHATCLNLNKANIDVQLGGKKWP